jgi:predicted TIM-barrel fold metal-dependent hydrolase
LPLRVPGQRYGIAHREEVGVDKLLWANDFPHSAGDWPESHRVIERLFAGVREPDVRAILHDNAARYFKLPVSATMGSSSS